MKQNAEVLNCIRTGQIGYTTWAFWPDRTEQLMINEIEKVWSGQLKVADFLVLPLVTPGILTVALIVLSPLSEHWLITVFNARSARNKLAAAGSTTL